MLDQEGPVVTALGAVRHQALMIRLDRRLQSRPRVLRQEIQDVATTLTDVLLYLPHANGGLDSARPLQEVGWNFVDWNCDDRVVGKNPLKLARDRELSETELLDHVLKPSGAFDFI